MDRRRKSDDQRTPDQLYHRVQCGNCRALAVEGDVIFSFDDGATFYDPAPSAPKPYLVWPPWNPKRPLPRPGGASSTVDSDSRKADEEDERMSLLGFIAVTILAAILGALFVDAFDRSFEARGAAAGYYPNYNY